LKNLRFRPLVPERWPDFVRLFGEKGACGGCWCMWMRLDQAKFERQKGLGNKRAMKRLVDSGQVPGVLAYSGDEPIGWCAVQPREVYVRLARSRILSKVDDRPVWSVTCFFVARPFRRNGVSAALLKAAVKHARTQGAKIVEGYPMEPGATYADAFVFPGLVSAFRQAGFEEAARRSKTRPIMRRVLGRSRAVAPA